MDNSIEPIRKFARFFHREIPTSSIKIPTSLNRRQTLVFHMENTLFHLYKIFSICVFYRFFVDQ